jgi:hypothetical protein
MIPIRGHQVHPEWNPHFDAVALRKAMKGFGTRDDALIAIIGCREREYMQKVRHEFTKIEKKPRDLIADVASECSFSYKEVACSLCETDAEYRAKVVMKGIVNFWVF